MLRKPENYVSGNTEEFNTEREREREKRGGGEGDREYSSFGTGGEGRSTDHC